MEHEKLYSPLNFYLRDKEDAQDGVYDEIHYWRDELSHEEAYAYIDQIEAYIDQIEAFLSRDRKTYDNGRGLMEYIGEGVLNDKVQSLVPSVELHGDKLWIVADVQLNEPLTPLEMANLKSFWGGQLSDGVGESWEQREIKVDRGDLYLEPWTSSAGFFIATQAEFDQRMRISHHTPEQSAGETDRDYFITATATFQGMTSTFGIPYTKEELPEFLQKMEFSALDIPIDATQHVSLDLSSNSGLGERLIPLLQGGTLSYANQVCKMLLHLPADRQDEINYDLAHGEISTSHELVNAITVEPVSFDQLIESIARKHTSFETLATRNRDSLDFKDISVWGLKSALEEAFAAGAAHQCSQQISEERTDAKPERISGEKPSVLAQLRDAKELPAAEKEKPAPKKSGPEL